MTPEYFDPTINPPRSASETLQVDTTFLNGQPTVPKPGVVWTFNGARSQDTKTLIRVSWISASTLDDKNLPLFPDGNRYTLTLRDLDGNYIVQDLPLCRIGNAPLQPGVVVRNLDFSPVYIDWRRSYIRGIQPLLAGVIALELWYQ